MQEYVTTEFLRMSGIYWGLTAMDLMGQLHRMGRDEVIGFVRGCQDKGSGGFSPSFGHDPHLLYTLSALQVSTAGVAISLVKTKDREVSPPR